MIWAAMQENLSSGFPTKQDSMQSPQLQRLARKLKFVASLDMILFKKRIIKPLIRLKGCAVFVVRKLPKTGFLASRPI